MEPNSNGVSEEVSEISEEVSEVGEEEQQKDFLIYEDYVPEYFIGPDGCSRVRFSDWSPNQPDYNRKIGIEVSNEDSVKFAKKLQERNLQKIRREEMEERIKAEKNLYKPSFQEDDRNREEIEYYRRYKIKPASPERICDKDVPLIINNEGVIVTHIASSSSPTKDRKTTFEHLQFNIEKSISDGNTLFKKESIDKHQVQASAIKNPSKKTNGIIKAFIQSEIDRLEA